MGSGLGCDINSPEGCCSTCNEDNRVTRLQPSPKCSNPPRPRLPIGLPMDDSKVVEDGGLVEIDLVHVECCLGCRRERVPEWPMVPPKPFCATPSEKEARQRQGEWGCERCRSIMPTLAHFPDCCPPSGASTPARPGSPSPKSTSRTVAEWPPRVAASSSCPDPPLRLPRAGAESRKPPKEEASVAARMMAALAVAKQHRPRSQAMALAYRLTEFCANLICLCGAPWLVSFWVVLGMAIVFWYLPAVLRTFSLWKPVRLPLLNFVVDDFSLLGLHPTPRPAALMYLVCLLRVLILIVAMPLCASASDTPEWWRYAFHVENGIHVLFRGEYLAGNRIPKESVEEWAVLVVVVLALAALWVLATVFLLAAAVCLAAGPFAWIEQPALQRDINALAQKIDDANRQSDWWVCLLQLKQLQQEHPSLKLTTVGSTLGPAVGTVVHLLLSINTAYTLFSHGHSYGITRFNDFVLGGVMVVNFVLTLMHNCSAGRRNPLAMLSEAKASFERGIFTDAYIKILYGDQGANVIVTLAVNVFGIPFRADDPFKVASAIMAILITVCTCVPFIFQQWDLGVEKEGYEHSGGVLVIGDARLRPAQPRPPKPPPEVSFKQEILHRLL